MASTYEISVIARNQLPHVVSGRWYETRCELISSKITEAGVGGGKEGGVAKEKDCAEHARTLRGVVRLVKEGRGKNRQIFV